MTPTFAFGLAALLHPVALISLLAAALSCLGLIGMAYEEGVTFRRYTGIANADLRTKQFYCVSRVSGDGKIDLATAAKNIDGILQGAPNTGQAGEFVNGGGVICKAAISASQALTGGVTLLEVDTGGTLKILASGTAVAKAAQTLSSTAAVCLAAVELLPSNAAFT